MNILPILIIRCPSSYTVNYREGLNELFSKILDGQYNVFVVSESKPMVSLEFEVYGVSNTVNQIADLMPIDQIKAMHKDGQGPEKSVDEIAQQIPDHLRARRNEIASITWDGTEEGVKMVRNFVQPHSICDILPYVLHVDKDVSEIYIHWPNARFIRIQKGDSLEKVTEIKHRKAHTI